MDERPSGTVTFLFTDIEGSTVLLRQLRDAYGELLATHSRLLRQAFEARAARRSTRRATPSSSRSAARRTPSTQPSRRSARWPKRHGRKGPTVKVRMGIHTGDASLAADRYLGLSVHRAARICSAGHGGQILISPTTYALLEDQEEELPGATQDLGAQRLKDFDRPIQIFQIVVPGLQESFPPLRTLEHTPFEGDEGRLADAARRASKPEREAKGTVRVLIADDQALVRAGFRMILEAEQDIEVVGEAVDGGQALDEVRRLVSGRRADGRADARPGRHRGDAAADVRPAVSSKVVMLTTFDMDEYVYEALQAGASGFLLKDVPPEQLVDGIRAVASGDALLAPSITKRVIEEFVRRPPEPRGRRHRGGRPDRPGAGGLEAGGARPLERGDRPRSSSSARRP